VTRNLLSKNSLPDGHETWRRSVRCQTLLTASSTKASTLIRIKSFHLLLRLGHMARAHHRMPTRHDHRALLPQTRIINLLKVPGDLCSHFSMAYSEASSIKLNKITIRIIHMPIRASRTPRTVIVIQEEEEGNQG
jgi:hypothetical protein